MPSKVQLYAQMADRTAEQITGSYQKWTAFLTTAARLYKYSYNEQLMIFAQRPEATACAEYDLWNKQMRRYVRQGSKGIALVDASSDQPKLRYVFDVSDTGGGGNSRRPYLWEYRQEHREVVSAALEQRFDVSGENGLADQMERVAAQLVDEYWHDNWRDIVGIVDGSFLEGYDDFNIGAAFRNAAVVSTNYALLSRCGMQPGDYFEHEDFLNVFDFNTPQTVAALGTAISQSSELVLRQIEVTIKNYEREKIAERSKSHERTDLHPQRGLSDPRTEPDRAAASPAGQVRQDAEELPEGASSGAVEQPAAVREAVPPSAGDRRGGEPEIGTDDAGADEVGGRDGSAESQRPDEVGGADEHAESAGRGNDPLGAGVQLNMFDAPAGAQMSFFPSEAEQIQSIAEAESVTQTPSAFSMFISPDDKAQSQEAAQNPLYNSYNDIKTAHPDEIVLYQVGDFFEMYGEDARQAELLLDLNLTSRNIPDVGRVTMCGIPAHSLEQYVEKLRDKYDVTIAATQEDSNERRIYTLRSVDHEAEAAIDAQEAEFGADGARVFREPAAEQPSQSTVQELFGGYKLTVGNALSKDTAFVNACRNSDRQNAYLEGADAIRRIVTASDDLQLVRLYFDMPAFHNRLHQELLEELYPTLATTVAPSPYKVTQEDIDDALQKWNGNPQSKQAVVRYMEQHGREKDTALWLAKEYGAGDTSQPLQISVGDSEPVILSWPRVQRRIAQLIREDQFFTEQEKDVRENNPDYQLLDRLRTDCEYFLGAGNRAEKHLWAGSVYAQIVKMRELYDELPQKPEWLTEEMIDDYADRMAPQYQVVVYHHFENGFDEKRDYQTLEEAEKAAQGYVDGTMESDGFAYDGAAIYDLRENRYLSIFGNYPDEKAQAQVEGREPPTVLEQEMPVPTAHDSLASSYKSGDTVYLDGKPFEITEVGLFDVHLRDPSQAYPIFRVESKERLPALLRQNERNAHLFTPEAQGQEQPQPVTKPVAFYPADKTHLPYDIEIQTLHIPEPEHDPPAAEPAEPEPPAMSEEERLTLEHEGRAALSEMGEFVPDFKDAISQAEIDEPPAPRPAVSIPIDGEWQDFPSVAAAEQAAYADFKAESHRNAQNFHITDDALGVGGAKAKFRANMAAIHLLQELEFEGVQASPEQQEILSRYVGWGGLADAFDENKSNWSDEFAELYATLSPEEYAAARASTLNAHYTSPTVIKAIYEAVGNMGFQTGNILEPSMGVGNFFGCLPESMKCSKLYGVELDSITGRIAKQLYPKADITIAGFETTDRKDFYDLAVGNVPFGQYQVDDRAYNKLGFSIHDYFFAKTLNQVRPGGVIAFVTSRYTMDKQSPEVRRYIAQRAELLGAIRLPNNAFRANAGTDVVSDILFLQKRDQPIDIEPDWVHLDRNEDGFAVNSYFVDHPEMILGRQTSESTQYGKQDFTVVPIEGLELADQLHDAVKNIRGTYQEAELPELGEGEQIDTSIPADPNMKNYSYAVVDGAVYYRENSRMVKPELNATAAERIKGMVALRDCVNELIALQMDEYSAESQIQDAQAELNRLYDAFSAKYGLINDRANRLAFADDSSYYLLCSLEVLDDEGKLKRKADMVHKRTIKQQRSVESVDTASEALAVSIGERACVDLSFMASLMGGSEKIPQIVEDLKGVIYKDPTSGPFDLESGGEHWAKGWQTADEYLSGNVRRKLRTAQRVAERDPFFAGNVDALIAAQPKDLEASEIEVRLGATWLDTKYIEQFMYETFDTPHYLRGRIEVSYVPYTAEWQVSHKSLIRDDDVAAYTTYGTDRASAYRLLEDALNLRDVRIYDTIEDADGRERRVLNGKETTLAAQKQQLIRDAFKDWIWKDPERRETLVRQYNEEMNSTRPREYDGSHIVFSGMNPEITLREHQKNAIAHVLYGGNTLLAHEVGAGKTFEMVASAMESKRLGLCQKSIFVVPNHLTDQWATEFLRLYPSANILVTTKKDFETRNRKKFCARIATGDYDGVIIGHSQFERIPISPERQERLPRQQIEEITDGIMDTKLAGGNSFTIKSLERTKKGLEARLKKLQASDRKDDVICFEQLGVDRMFVDESDNYKNLFLYTKMRNVAGLSTTDAQKSSDMFSKCRYMDELTGGRGVVFATGTPVSNSMTELYTIQRYLQHDRLQEMGMSHFDCWASRFGETTTALELAPEGISITRYDSISGEELNPYRRLSAGSIQTIVGGKQNYKAIIHKRIPIHSVGIEIFPAYYEDYLKKQYPDAYFDLSATFQSVDQAADFPAMSKLLFEIENYRGDGIAAALFYEAKVTEAIALVVDNQKKQAVQNAHPLSRADIAGLENVAGYIADHYAFDIPLSRLASIACMSESKLKSCFKRQFGCSVTQYIQGRRMSQAEHLLIDTDFTMGQIAQMIGYSTSSRFAGLFKKSTGILPIEYRKIARKDP